MKCEKCENEGGTKELHPCPYAEDIEDVHEDVCNCCADCEGECALDI